VAVTRENGIEELAHFDAVVGTEETAMGTVLGAMKHNNPELAGKLRLVPVIVDIREMTEEEIAERRNAGLA